MSNMAAKGTVYYKNEAYRQLNIYLKNQAPSKIFILVDQNTHRDCLSQFAKKISGSYTIEILEIEAGEIHKNLDTCNQLWKAMSELDGDRKSLMINLGGGVVTDLGGFVASCFKRGINYINVPTSLLAMVDASVGGKTGIDLGNLKNQIGVINHSEMVIIDSVFLNTLPASQMRSGLAEILKHSLINDESYWEKVSSLKDLSLDDLDEIIKESVDIKAEVVTKDPRENGLRKTLNYGHTLGHAIESYCLENTERPSLLHGEAIAVGMILASYISVELQSFPKEKLKNITSVIVDIYGKEEFSKKEISAIIELMKHDKKNEFGKIKFVLLKDIGKPVIDCLVPNQVIEEAFNFYAKS